ncbi:MAG: carbon monoxide dehydrogenase [Calditrichaeota bacterium]|nr:MAG: carbon monoxide dehydrogenase [Calditrichota bacterium]
MKIQGDYTFEGDRQTVWNLLQDPDVLARAMPGTRKLEKTGPDTYEGTIAMKIGPVNDVFSGKVELKDKVEPSSYTMQVDGKGNSGFARVTAQVELAELEGGKTRLTYQADLQVGGRLASVGQRLLDSVGRSLIRQSFDAINQQLSAQLAGQPETAPEAPTTGQVARRVAADVAKETLRSQPLIIAAVIVLLIVLVIWLFLKLSS